jgi:hypothetical protein
MCQTMEGVRGVTSTRTVLPATLCHIRCYHSVHVNPHATTAHHRATHATSPDMPPPSKSQRLDGDIDRIVADAIAQIHGTALDTTSSETTRHCLRRNSIACGALNTKPLQKLPRRVIRQVEEQHLQHPSTIAALSRHTSTRSSITTTPSITTICVKADEQSSHKDRLVFPSPLTSLISQNHVHSIPPMTVMTALLLSAPRAGVVRQNQLQSLPLTNMTITLLHSTPHTSMTRQAPATIYCAGKEDIRFLLLNTMHVRR